MGRGASGTIWSAVVVLIAIVVVFVGIRLATDVPNLTSGTIPDEGTFEHRYARFAWLAYAHILPGVLYLLIAPIQLWRGFRNGHFVVHRRMGRVALLAGIVSGIFAIVFGAFQAFGGLLQASAAIAFGAWFLVALATAYRAIRGRDVRTHRRWMIRAFAVGVAVGTIRLWIGLFEALGLMSFRDAFGVAFWLSFVMHALAAELYLRWRPSAAGSAATRAPAT
ncbi:MAG TPA: DUF2306 domain-containing protein [Candidatus Limnocylindria bacterium]